MVDRSDSPVPSSQTTLLEEPLVALIAVHRDPSPPASKPYVPRSLTPNAQNAPDSPPPLPIAGPPKYGATAPLFARSTPMVTNARPEDNQYPPLLPGTTATILRITDNADIGKTARAVSWGLVHTIRQRTAIAEEHLTATRTRIRELEGTVQRREWEIHHLRNRWRNPKMPPDYEQNRGRLNVQIADSEGRMVAARWIRRMGNGEVLARAGEEEDEPEYVVSLYLESNYSQHPTSPMPRWFLELLQGPGAPYNTLAETVRQLPDMAAFTEVERYRRHHKHRATLKAQRRTIIAELDLKDAHLDGIQFRMEEYGLHECVAILANRVDIRPRDLPGQAQPQRQHSRRFCHPGPGGPG